MYICDIHKCINQSGEINWCPCVTYSVMVEISEMCKRKKP